MGLELRVPPVVRERGANRIKKDLNCFKSGMKCEGIYTTERVTFN